MNRLVAAALSLALLSGIAACSHPTATTHPAGDSVTDGHGGYVTDWAKGANNGWETDVPPNSERLESPAYLDAEGSDIECPDEQSDPRDRALFDLGRFDAMLVLNRDGRAAYQKFKTRVQAAMPSDPCDAGSYNAVVEGVEEAGDEISTDHDLRKLMSK